MNLLGFLKKNVNKRIGTYTTRVEDEAFQVLQKAVTDVIGRELKKPSINREVVYRNMSIYVNQCEERLREIRDYLVREPIHPVQESKIFLQVTNMYEELKKEAQSLNPQNLAYEQAGVAPIGYKTIAYEIYKDQRNVEGAQLINLLYNPPGDNDKLHLSGAIYLNNLYKQMESKDITFYFASTDHHFSPMRFPGAKESRKVTDEIERRFGIICDRPQQILNIISKK